MNAIIDTILLAVLLAADVVRSCAIALVTPVLEKNPMKTLGAGRFGGATVVLSMTRLIVLAFAIGVLHQIWHSGVHGWPEATLAIAIVLAMPILGALDRARPHEVLALAKFLFSRFGHGDVARPSRLDVEPSKYDDHRSDCHPERSSTVIPSEARDLLLTQSQEAA